MHNRAFLGGSGWARGGPAGSGVVRRAHPASGAQWNVQVVRGKVNGKCLWNACKALSLGLLLMVLGAAMATIGYYADDLSMAQEVRGNYTVQVKNESRGFHLNNLSYAGPIVMGVGGFIVVAACVMTFEARDSAAKVVPARFKLSTVGPPPTGSGIPCIHQAGAVHATNIAGGIHHHQIPMGVGATCPAQSANTGTSINAAGNNIRSSGSQTTTTGAGNATSGNDHQRHRRALTQAFMQFSRALDMDGVAIGDGLGAGVMLGGLTAAAAAAASAARNHSRGCNLLKVSQSSLSKSPSAPDLALKRSNSTDRSTPPQTLHHHCTARGTKPRTASDKSRRTFAACALLNPQLLHRHALSVDETAAAASYRLSHESLHGSQGSMALDLHLEYPVTLRVCDRRKNPPLQRQRKIELEEAAGGNNTTVQPVEDGSSRRSSHSCSPRLPSSHHTKDLIMNATVSGGSAQQLPTYATTPISSATAARRSSNASDCTHRSRNRRRDCPHHGTAGSGGRARLERAISSDSRLTGNAASALKGPSSSRCTCCPHHHHHKTQSQKQHQHPSGGGGGATRHQCRPPPVRRHTSAQNSVEREREQRQEKSEGKQEGAAASCSSDSDIRKLRNH